MPRASGTLTDTALLQGGQDMAPVNVAASYTAQPTDSWVRVTTGATNMTVTLPQLSAVPVGATLIITKVDAGTGTLSVAAASGNSVPVNTVGSSGARGTLVLKAADAATWDVVSRY